MVVWIEMKNVTKKYKENFVLNNVSLKVEKGKIVGVFGPTGCGKTTLLKVIAGLEIPESGEVYLRGKKVFGREISVPPEKRNISFIFQDLGLWDCLKAQRT